MAKPVRIEISFSPLDYPDQVQVYIPPHENYREMLLGAQVGDGISFRHEDKYFFGTVARRSFASRTPTDPEDSDWMLQLHLSNS
ncbi:hypothetical protein LOY35_25900 [Pseudomonas sp. B21-028]|jgi:hypothetical protein|uniref:hypothetical protein n=1 Tax=Pseudomonas sp. B21-028 TaxID=2895480 RepID=UPI002160B787|nr:hypothetical protein [Pseudomonas sp. B21-028]UVL83561.1 hypothetical protein LOY35_25900 [Pseudomonas sp. B21-028]